MIKYAYILLGVSLLVVGAIGTVVPLVPTTPLVIGAAFCFGKSSQKLHTWFLSTRLYRRAIEGFVRNRAMTIKTKVILLTSITVFMGLSYLTMVFFNASFIPRIILIVIWLCHVVYFGFIAKTVRN